ncbi:putative Dual specificity phosphatase, catalytic domain [Monocercomonoides exilis]|uniref:putative Dual specificity phosphatase, catalytic domain n=1 Tax=Monocercomonoides exilis TaxID=2049356 RepID=UPI003559E4E0|nr:putative Dual specificity phosphatase, catalytic domain [Monocercomonoides exilis]|eukprot:MONOS_12524.1-p1 / transcript=MONOS_12524.1 / gene=MONOS_12524 / organism=Monocercomonoides_exilis_PA203 / gene_product=unspecified product / transcript_product=unspecified product / location=Mono_scaffold00697:29403-30062(-) / protein_length=164 / sequence_SO=supercontig / SO=protein_coding / is_pseudo=false
MQVEVNFRTQGHTYSRQQPSILFGRTRTAPPYFTEIIPRELYISNLEGACDLINLHAKGITHIVSVLKTRCSDECSKSIQRLWLPIVDSAAKVREFESLWPEALKFLRDCRKSHGTALVHCRAGMSRSSTVVLAHLMEYDCLSLRDAWNLLKGLHEIASPITVC